MFIGALTQVYTSTLRFKVFGEIAQQAHQKILACDAVSCMLFSDIDSVKLPAHAAIGRYLGWNTCDTAVDL